jgi:hypothetical protein
MNGNALVVIAVFAIIQRAEALASTLRIPHTRRSKVHLAAKGDDSERSPMTMAEENDGPKISIEDDGNENRRAQGEKPKSYSNSRSTSSATTGFNTNKLFMDEEERKKQDSTAKQAKGSATFGGMTIDDLQSRMQESPYRAQSWDDLPDQKEDLNGINPITTILFSVFPMGMCFVLIQVTSWLSTHFAINQVGSSIYPIQRGAVIARNLVVGISSLATGFTGVVGVGLLAMGAAVAVGVAKGELDPDADNLTGRVK